MKKPYYYSVLFFLALVFGSQRQALASHIIGAEISYKCTTTPGIFEATLILYRNCDGGVELCMGGCGSSCTQTLSIQGADPSCVSATFGSAIMNLVSVRDVVMNAGCPNVKNTCGNMGCVTPGSYTPGIERYEFKGLVNIGATSGIPAACCNVRLSWELCCRSGQIATGSAGQNFYIDAVINRCLSVSPCNSSPELDEFPFTLCGGESAILNAGGVDPDFDSLSFAFAPALQGGNSSVTYTAPWSFNTPLPWTGPANGQFPAGIRCDPLTGQIMFTPTNSSGSNWHGLLAVEIKQWKTINGVPTVIGITRRDQEVIVLATCAPNNVPRLTSEPPSLANPNSPRTQWEVCAGEQLCFNIIAKDTDFAPPTISDTTYLSWNQALATLGATFLPTYIPSDRRKPAPLGGPREDKYQFCWTPTDNLASNTPYYFVVTGKDNRCPNPGKITRAFSIKVLPTVNITLTANGDSCGKWTLGYTKNKPSQNVTGIWHIAKDTSDYTFSNGYYTVANTSGTAQANFRKPGKYLVRFTSQIPNGSSGSCTKIYEDTLDVKVVTSMTDSISKTNAFCLGQNNGSITLKGKNGVAPYQYRLNQMPYGSAATFNNLAPGEYIAWVKDAGGCEIYDTVQITQLSSTPVTSSFTITPASCYHIPDGIISIAASGGTPPYQYSLNAGPFQSGSSFSSLKTGLYAVIVKDINNCIDIDSIVVPAPPKVSVDTIIGETSVGHHELETYAITIQSGVSYTWTVKKGVIINTGPSSVTVNWDTVGTGSVAVTAVGAEPGCAVTTTIPVTVGATGLNDLAKQFGLEVFPNPATSILNITLKTLPEDKTITLYDIQGRVMIQQPLEEHQQLNIDQLAKGIYILKIADWRGRIIKQ
jgi:hypothetical protein